MLKPADGVEGFKKFVLDTVKLAGSNPCPPIVLGIGVGGSFDKVAYLAKKALLRPLDVPNPDPYYAQLEQELLAAINELGIGPQALAAGPPVWALPLSRCYPCGGPACGGEYFLPCDPPCKRRTVRRAKMEYRLTTPCTAEDLAPLKAGDTVLLSGVVYTARDQAHRRMTEALEKGEPLPFCRSC